MIILNLPNEILTHVLVHLEPRDIVHVGQTCHQLHDTVKPANGFIWHASFLQIFDNPQHAWHLFPHLQKQSDEQQQADYWYSQIKRRFSAIKSIRPGARGSFEDYGLSAEEVIDSVLDILDTAKAGPTEADVARGILPMVDDRRSLNLSLLNCKDECWTRLENLIHDCHVANEERSSPPGDGRPLTRSVTASRKHNLRSQNASRLHIFYGRTVRERIEHGQKGMARSIVYDWTNPCPQNDYGPLKKDKTGTVDWKVLEACASVMLRHFEIGADGQIVIPQGFCYALPCRTLTDPNLPDDWAKVTGRYIGTYSFLDYSDLFAFNTEPHNPWELEDCPETHGDLMMLDLKLDNSLRDDPRLRSYLPRNTETLPVLYFSGDSSAFTPYGRPRLIIHVIGSVSLCPNGKEVRWRYIISYRGQEQWVLEGIQPGGIRSGPIFGLWTQWGHDEHSPVGAFMYIPEELCKRQELVLVR